MATEVVKVIDPDNGTGADYTSLSAWEAGEEKDLQQADEIAVAKCRCTGGSADTDAVVIDGSWNPDATRYIKIWTDPSEGYRHDGKWNDSKYRLVNNADSYALDVNEPYTKIEGLQIRQTGPGDYNHALDVRNASYFEVSYTIVRGCNGNNAKGIYGSVSEGPVKLWNNIVYDFNSSDGIVLSISTAGQKAYVYNNTVYNCNIGIYSGGYQDIVAKNNLVQDCTDGYEGDFDSDSDYNISDISGDAPGANSKTCTVSFVDEANDDFHLASSDTCTRSGTWDIGADEYVVAGGLIKIMDETVSISETLIRRLYANRFIGETVAITETMPRRGYSNRLINETITISEGILRRLRSNRIINETISIAEAISRRAFSSRVINETLSIAEAVLKRLRAVRIISETVSVSESLVRRLRSIRIISETIGITENFVRSCVATLVKIMNEVISITENLVKIKTFIETVSEVTIGKIIFHAHRASIGFKNFYSSIEFKKFCSSISFKKFMAKISFKRKGD